MQKKKTKAIKGGLARVSELFKDTGRRSAEPWRQKAFGAETANGNAPRDPEMVSLASIFIVVNIF